MMGCVLLGVLADEILVQQVMFPSLMNGIQTHSGKRASVCRWRTRKGMAGRMLYFRHGDMALLKT